MSFWKGVITVATAAVAFVSGRPAQGFSLLANHFGNQLHASLLQSQSSFRTSISQKPSGSEEDNDDWRYRPILGNLDGNVELKNTLKHT